jgi:ATP-dependent DNA helicase RecG
MVWSDALSTLKGVGPKMQAALQSLSCVSVFDLLLHRPLRYEDRTVFTAMSALACTPDKTMVVVCGWIKAIEQSPYAHQKNLRVVLEDGSGTCVLHWIHYSGYQLSALRRAFKDKARLWCYGRISHKKILTHPSIKVLVEGEEDGLGAESYYRAIYPTVSGLSQTFLSRIVAQGLEGGVGVYPDRVESTTSLCVQEAFTILHRRSKDTLGDYECAVRRLKIEEWCAYISAQKCLRIKDQHKSAMALSWSKDWEAAFRQQLPYRLTAEQDRVVEEIREDLQKKIPMRRLLQGDVGSGKTVVVAMACLMAMASQGQVALMVPSEILAIQHADLLRRWFACLSLPVYLCCASSSQESYTQPCCVVGTQALLNKKRHFSRLMLVIVDEQHRFGLEQRAWLLQKGQTPHYLMMTATPIPKTMAALLSYGMDLSRIHGLPPGRQPIRTVILSDDKLNNLLEKVQTLIEEGRQIYRVCARLESLKKRYEELASYVDRRCMGYVHGRMKMVEKTAVMTAFQEGKYSVLMATSVIEVGIDVPRASVMVIDGASAFGIASLHQLRGRVGRGERESFCILLYTQPLNERAQKRLRLVRELQDGAALAEADLRLRGPGALHDTEQSGALGWRLLDLSEDGALLGSAQDFLSAQPLTLQEQEHLFDFWYGRP